MGKTNLAEYQNHNYQPGANWLKRILWFYISAIIFKTSFFPSSGFKVFLLRMFGSKIGKNVVVRHRLNIKFPWFLTVGDFSWIGEEVWIDNLVPVKFGANVCLSQGAVLLTGNHNYSKKNFDLITGGIFLANGVWIGAKAIVCPNVYADEHAVLAAGSIATKNMEAYFVYQGNPAVKVRKRQIED
ncbi:colanic acid biosynthesis acetyltransferase WcaF [Mucilaginibacter sp. HMF7410]|uniref:Colanic acid biosynthesis acetyltransferase WcaF n=1 Tax=Mucilaginibacter arboris TaxID=2682090 RepID=A0A7K1STH7_9SPHI|nr:colanic acid biosynthesis acetyltransferase WcaF [Mucilaginibacter arboris]